MTTTVNKTITDWHEWLARALAEALTRLGVDVRTNFLVMSQPPKGDVLLLRCQAGDWTCEQRALLPDGIRDCKARYIIIEFKYTESINMDVFFQVTSYYFHYRDTQNLKREDLQLFILSAKTPQKSRLAKWGYQEAEHPGVYRSNSEFFSFFPILALNKLRPTANNALVKSFAKRASERQKALGVLKEQDVVKYFSTDLSHFLAGLAIEWQIGEQMDIELTTEQVLEAGKLWGNVFLDKLPLPQVLSHYKPQEVFSYYKPEERLAGLKAEERLAGLKLEERFAGLTPEQIRAYLVMIEQEGA